MAFGDVAKISHGNRSGGVVETGTSSWMRGAACTSMTSRSAGASTLHVEHQGADIRDV